MTNAINWFEIPVIDLARAKQFYETILGTEMHAFEAMGMHCAFFPTDMQQGAIGGGLMQGPGYEPSATGTLAYLNGGDDLAVPLAKVEIAGGKIVLPKTSIGPNGFMAHFIDTEGNKVAFHSMK
jgi:predicted enzyme related to lactoylglutathione lyase